MPCELGSPRSGNHGEALSMSRHGHDHSRAHDDGHRHSHDEGHAHGQADGHSHGHGHAHGPANHDRAFAIGIAINLVFVAVEAFYGWRADSLALLADAGHNLGDVAGLVLAWAGAFAGRLAPDARHTYGWKRASILAAFANSLLLLVAVGSLAWVAIGRLAAPEVVQAHIVIVVASIGIVVNLATALLFMRGRHDDLNIRGAFLHMAADAAVSAGVVAAAALTLWLGWTWLDPIASLVIVVVILVGTWGLFRDSLHLMFDGVPASIDLDAVRTELEALPGVACVSDLHVWATGTTEIALTAHLVTPAGHPDDAFFRAAAARMRERFAIGHVTLQAATEELMAPCAPAAASAPRELAMTRP
ncbi:MAG: cation diffusion facilitator family transporter [Caldimonas sp.]